MDKLIRLTIRLLMVVAVLVVTGVGLFLLRNDQMDRGVHSLKEENGTAALQRLKPLAHLGDKTAQMLVGLIYAYGWGKIPKSDADAIYWFHRCGTIGNLVVEDDVDPAAPLELSVAKSYASGGEGVKADPAESVKWLKQAAKDGSKEAAAMLAQ